MTRIPTFAVCCVFVFNIEGVEDSDEGREFEFKCIDRTLPILIPPMPVTNALSNVGFTTAIKPRCIYPQTQRRALHKLYKTLSTEQCLMH